MKLDDLNLSVTLSDPAFKYIYKRQLERLYDLGTMAFEKGLPVVILFEGWDAAGKGTSIRYLTRRLDPRGFKVYDIQAPRTHEKRMPWLWRFWMQIPRRGQIAIFDRSWYGRVLIERVEGFTPIPDWIRAYEEINEFERTLAADGMLFIKFWLHITRPEQLRRFILLAQDPDRAWQVTQEDWQRHQKYDQYLAAVRDMVNNTDTNEAPWTLIPATDANYRTYAIFSTVINRMEQALQQPPTPWPTPEQLEQKVADKAKRVGEEGQPPDSSEDDNDVSDDSP